MITTVITGGAGFIGFHLAQRILAERADARVILVDNMQRGKMDSALRALLMNGRVHLLRLDLLNPHDLAQLDHLVDHVDEVYHLAAVNGTRHFYTKPDAVLRTNTLALIHLLDWIVGRGGKPPRLLFTSSNEAYAGTVELYGRLGAELPIPTPEAIALTIVDPYNPRWSYGASKLVGELMVIHTAAAHGIPAIIVRPHNFYGPRAGSDHVIPELLARIATRADPFQLLGHNDTRSFCYITDAVDAMVKLMDCATPATPTVHIGSHDETRIDALADQLFEIAGWRPARIDCRSSPLGSAPRRRPNVELVRKMTGWVARTDLQDGLRKTIAWYQEHA